MEGKARTFNQLKKQKTFEEFNEFSKEITELYATTPIEYSQNNVAKDNNLTVKTVRKVMDYAIETAQVTLDIVTLVLNKLIQNQQRKAQEAGGSSINHHKELMRVRVEYLAGSYLNQEVNKIATDIASNFAYSIHQFTKKYNIESERVTKRILERAIVENIVSDEVMEKLIERSLKENKNERVKQYFEYLKKEREKNKKENS